MNSTLVNEEESLSDGSDERDVGAEYNFANDNKLDNSFSDDGDLQNDFLDN